MKLNTHNRTPRPKNSKFVTFFFVLCAVLLFGPCGLLAFACIVYGESVFGGIFTISVLVVMTAILIIFLKDIEKA